MDEFGGLLDGPRAQSAFLLKAVFSPPWTISVEDEAPLTLVVMARGHATFTGSAGATRVSAGDVIIARGPRPYEMRDGEDCSPIRILPGQVCVDDGGVLVAQDMARDVRTWGNVADGETVMLIGTYNRATSVGNRVLASLPGDAVLRGLDSPLVDLLAAEITQDSSGQASVLDRLLDLLLVTCLRVLFAGADAPRWASAYDDPIVGRAMRLMHNNVAHPWTVLALAEACGVSRATFARRFSGLVGEPPAAYLTGWRLALAADLLASTDRTIASVATEVGYSNAFALSSAFKRVFGVAPAHYREQVA